MQRDIFPLNSQNWNGKIVLTFCEIYLIINYRHQIMGRYSRERFMKIQIRGWIFGAVISGLLISLMVNPAYAAKSNKANPVAGRDREGLNTILNGIGAPKTKIGRNGDFYIDVKSFNFYGPKKNGKWSLGINLRGPQGVSGVDGKTGERGATTSGSSGAKGEKGDKGERGEAGSSGAAGPAGPAGPAGAPGSDGAAGPAGAIGPAGATGATGAIGATGSVGATGAKGDTGDAGSSNVFVGALNFSSRLEGSAGQGVYSDTFLTLSPGNSYLIDLIIIGQNDESTAQMPLKFEPFALGDAPVISDVKWANTSMQSYRNGVVKTEYVITARFAVDGSLTSQNYSLRVLVTGGLTTSSTGRPVTFLGNYEAQIVGSVSR